MIFWRGNQPLQFFTSEDACKCEPSLCFPVKAGDITEFQLDLRSFTGEELLTNGSFRPYVSGTADAGSGATTLIDAGSSFQNFGIGVGWVVKNTTSGVEGTVDAVVSQTELTTTNPFANGDGYQIYAWEGNNISRWGFDGENLTRSATAGSDTIEGVTPELCPQSMYLVRIDVVAASTSASTLMTIDLGGSGTNIVSNPQIQEYFIFITPDASITSNLLFGTNGVGQGLSIDTISVREVSTPGIVIKNCQTGAIVYADYDNSDNLIQFLSGSLESSDAAKAVVSIDWQQIGIEDGCYEVCIVETNEQCREYICNGTFTTISGASTTTVANKLRDSSEDFRIYDLYFNHTTIFDTSDAVTALINGMDSPVQLAISADIFTSGNSWRLANCWVTEGWEINGFASHTTPDASDYLYQTLKVPLKANVRYRLTFDLVIASGTLTVKYNTGSLTDQTLGTTTTSGAKEFTITGIDMTRLTFSASGAVITSLDNVSIMPDFEYYSPVYGDCVLFSECVCVNDHPCTKLIEGTNSGNGYAYVGGKDIDLGGGNSLNFTDFTWSMSLRIPVNKWHPRMKDRSFIQFVTDSASGIVAHANAYPVWRMVIGEMPSNRLIALFNMTRMDFFYVDSTRYFVEFDELDAPFDDWSDSAETEIELREQYVKFENTNV